MEGNSPKPYDSGSKRLLAISAQALLDLFAPGLHFTGQFSEQFHSDEIEADAMIETVDANDNREMVHFEFQSKADPNMAERLLDYSYRAHRRYSCPIRSIVLYLRECGVPTPPLIRKYADGELYHWFNYKVIEVAKIPHRDMLDQGRQGLFPLVPLMKDGARREVIEEIIERYLPADDTITQECIALTRLFASLAFDKDDREIQEWIKRRFTMLRNIFRDTYIYQCDVEEGREKGIEEERQARLQVQRELLLAIVEAHFPALVSMAKTQADQIGDVTIVEKIVRGVGTAKTVKEAQHHLLEWNQNQITDQNTMRNKATRKVKRGERKKDSSGGDL